MIRTVEGPPLRVFINYRRGDSGGHAGRVYDALVERFGSECIFMDVDTIDFGVDFSEVIDQWVGSCDVFIALIGNNWLGASDSRGQRRLENPNDLVRLEIEAALERHIRVIPALVQGAEMPSSVELPDPLKRLSRRNAIELSDTRWRSDLDRLIRALERIEGETRQRDAPAVDVDSEGVAEPVLGAQDVLGAVDPLPVAADTAARNRPRPRRLALAGIVAAGVLGGAGLTLWHFVLGGEQTEKAKHPSGTQVTAASARGQLKAGYLTEISLPIRQIGRSAGAIGHVLATTGRPSDLSRVRKTAGSELALLQRVRSDLAETAAGESERKGHLHLLRATTSHRRYLALLVRATREGTTNGLATLPAARATVRNALSQYRSFFAAQPQLTDVISDSGMGDLSGVRAALSAARARPSAPSATTARRFTSVDRLQHCSMTSSYVRCGSAPSGQVVLLRLGGRATYLGRLGAKDNGGPALSLGAFIRSPSGKIRCDSSSRGITCTDHSSGASFTIGDQRYVLSNPGRQAPGPPSAVGVPRLHSGTFTSVDRRQHCYVTNSFVRCGSGPSGEVVQLQAGATATYLGVLGSRDNGGPSMPEGTSFQTPAASIECDSSSRGISCKDITGQSNGSFTIGDHHHRLSNVTPPSSQTGVPSRYTGKFTSVDRRQHCIAESRYVRCGSGPSGQVVELRVGMQASYLGVLGSNDSGGVSMPEGTLFRTPSGAIECRSSSRGITCTDLTGTGQAFTIGDRYVDVNGVVTRR